MQCGHSSITHAACKHWSSHALTVLCRAAVQENANMMTESNSKPTVASTHVPDCKRSCARGLDDQKQTLLMLQEQQSSSRLSHGSEGQGVTRSESRDSIEPAVPLKQQQTDSQDTYRLHSSGSQQFILAVHYWMKSGFSNACVVEQGCVCLIPQHMQF